MVSRTPCRACLSRRGIAWSNHTMCLQCKILAKLRLGYFWENVTSFRKKEKYWIYTASQRKAQNVLEKNDFLTHSMQFYYRNVRKWSMLFIISLLQSWKDWKDMGGIVVTPSTHSATQKLDLVSVTEQLCVRDRDKMGPLLSQSSNFSVWLYQCSKKYIYLEYLSNSINNHKCFTSENVFLQLQNGML